MELAGGRLAALPLPEVWRLETFPRSAIEKSSSGEVVQYRGRIVPLVDVAAVLFGAPTGGARPEVVPVVIMQAAGKAADVGLLVERIADILEVDAEIQKSADRPGLLGAAVLGGRVVDILDLHWLAGRPASGAPRAGAA